MEKSKFHHLWLFDLLMIENIQMINPLSSSQCLTVASDENFRKISFHHSLNFRYQICWISYSRIFFLKVSLDEKKPYLDLAHVLNSQQSWLFSKEKNSNELDFSICFDFKQDCLIFSLPNKGEVSFRQSQKNKNLRNLSEFLVLYCSKRKKRLKITRTSETVSAFKGPFGLK